MDRQRLLGFSSDACLNALQVKVFFCTKMVVSENRGTPQSSILLRFSIITIHFGVLFFRTPQKVLRWSSNWILGDGWWRPRHWACTTGCTSTAKYSAWASRGSNDPPMLFTCLHMSSLLNTLIFRDFPLLRLFSREHSSTSWAFYRLQPMKKASLTNCWSYTNDCSLLGGWTTRPRKHVESNDCGPTPLRLTKGSQLQMETGGSDSSGGCSPDWPEVLVPFQHPKLSQLGTTNPKHEHLEQCIEKPSWLQ